MRELHRHTGVGQLLTQNGFLPCLLLKGDDVVSKLILLGVVGHIEQTKRHLAQTACCRHEVATLHNAMDEFVRQGLARLIVEGEGAQKIFFYSVVLHELRGQLHKVPPHIGTTETLETGVGKHAVQRVAKLVEEGLHLAKRQQRGFFCRGLRKVHHHRDVGTHIHAFLVDILSLILSHPCSTLLAFAGVEVGIEHSQEGAVLVEHLVGLHVRVINGNILILLERDAIEFVGQSKDAIDNLVQLEVRTQHLGIKVVFLQLKLVCIEGGIPLLYLVNL